MTYPATAMPSMTDHVRGKWGWFLALGIVFLLGGFFALISPLIASLVVTTFVGIGFMIAGVIQIIHAWQMRSWAGFIWQLIIGIVVLVGGISIYWNPVVGALTLTLFLGAMFLAKGIIQIILGFQVRPIAGSIWILLAGALAIIVGLMILFDWPFSSTYAPGVLAGISFMFTGWSYIALSLAARRA